MIIRTGALPRAATRSTCRLLPVAQRQRSTFVEPPTRITTLPNRIRVATNEVPEHIQSVSVHVAAGSRYELDENSGSSFALAKLAFKSTSNRSLLDYALAMEKYVSTLQCHLGRESLLYQAHFPSRHLGPVLSLVSDTILHPTISPEEVEEMLEAAAYELRLYDEKTDAFLMEVLQNVAFGGEALGRPTLPKFEAVDGCGDGSISVESLKRFRELYFRPERLVIAGTGMDHDALVKVVQEQFGHLPVTPDILAAAAAVSPDGPSLPTPPSSPQPSSPSSSYQFSSISSSVQNLYKSFATLTPPPSPTGSSASELSASTVSVPPVGFPQTKYTGGISIETRQEMELSHVFIGCEGVNANDDDVYALAVIQMLLGDGASFSSGGPGKGLLSRFYTGVMCGAYGIDNVNSLNLPYSDAGLFAVSVACQPQALNRTINRLSYELASLLDPNNTAYPVANVELMRAKNRLKSAMLYAREDPRVEGEDLGSQVLVNGKRMPIGTMVDRIDQVTMDDLARVAKRVLVDGVGNGELTIVARGPQGIDKAPAMVKRAWSSKGLATGSL